MAKAWLRRALRARAISKWACHEQPTFVLWRETFSSTFSSGAKMSRAFACADQRLMASPLRQTSHSAMDRGFLPPFFFCGCWCNFFSPPPYQRHQMLTIMNTCILTSWQTVSCETLTLPRMKTSGPLPYKHVTSVLRVISTFFFFILWS